MPLIVSPGLVIAPVGGSDAHYPLLGWHNQVTFSRVSAESEAAGYPATNLANPSTANRWVSASTAEQLVTVDTLDGTIDYVGIARHNFGSADIAVSVEVITAEPGAVWTEVASAAPASDEPLVFRLEAGLYIGMRLRLAPGGGVPPSAAVLFVGELIAVRPGLRTGFSPAREARDVDLVQGMSISGEYLGAIVEGSALSDSLEFELMDPDFYDEFVRDFVRGASDGAPFFFVWDPATHPDDATFNWLTRGARPVVSQTTGEIKLTLSIGGLAL